MTIPLDVVSEIDTGSTKVGEENRDVLDVPFDGTHFQCFAEQTIGRAKVLGVHTQLECGTLVGARGLCLFERQVVCPIHSDGEAPIVEPAVTNCPKFFGVFWHPGQDSAKSIQRRFCKNSGLGRK